MMKMRKCNVPVSANLRRSLRVLERKGDDIYFKKCNIPVHLLFIMPLRNNGGTNQHRANKNGSLSHETQEIMFYTSIYFIH